MEKYHNLSYLDLYVKNKNKEKIYIFSKKLNFFFEKILNQKKYIIR